MPGSLTILKKHKMNELQSDAPAPPAKWKVIPYLSWRNKYDREFTWQFVGLLLVGLGILLYAFISLFQDIQKKLFIKSEAKIINREIKRDVRTNYSKTNKQVSYSFIPIIEYRYLVEGKIYTSKDSALNRNVRFSEEKKAWEVLQAYGDGKIVTCYYDANSPEKSVLHTDISTGSIIGLVIMGLVFFIPGFLLVFIH